MDSIATKSEIFDEDGEVMSVENEDRKRKTRNENEKRRRDQFNSLINELMSLVTQGSERKMDKSLVLCTAINLLKSHKDVHMRKQKVTAQFHPSFLSTAEFCQIMLETMNGFIVAINQEGGIMYVSENVLGILGHEPSSMVNRKIFSFIHSSEHFDVNSHLQQQFSSSNITDEVEQRLHQQKVEFSCHVLRSALEDNKDSQYEFCRLSGGFKKVDKPFSGESTICLVGVVQTMKPMFYKNISIIDKSNNEFNARLSLEWKFLLLDHRASSIIGYLPFEVLGTCSYDYNHFDDLDTLFDCHQKLLEYGAVMSGHYRFLTKGHQWIWLKTHFYITYNQWNSKPEFIACTNTAISYSDVIKARNVTSSPSDQYSSRSSAGDSDSFSDVPCQVSGSGSDHYGKM